MYMYIYIYIHILLYIPLHTYPQFFTTPSHLSNLRYEQNYTYYISTRVAQAADPQCPGIFFDVYWAIEHGKFLEVEEV